MSAHHLTYIYYFLFTKYIILDGWGGGNWGVFCFGLVVRKEEEKKKDDCWMMLVQVKERVPWFFWLFFKHYCFHYWVFYFCCFRIFLVGFYCFIARCFGKGREERTAEKVGKEGRKEGRRKLHVGAETREKRKKRDGERRKKMERGGE